MPSQYQFACPHCDAINKISTRDAGRTLNCAACDAEFDAPTLRELKTLPPVSDDAPGVVSIVETASSAEGWERRHCAR